MTGAELLEVLRNAVSKVHLGDGRFLQVSGIRFRYRVAGTETEPIYRIEPSDVEVWSRGEGSSQSPTKSPRGEGETGSVGGSQAGYAPLDLARRYTVSSLDYLWENGYRDGYAIFSKGKGGISPARIDGGASPSWRTTTEEAIAAMPNRRVTIRIEGRIRPY